MVIAFSLQGFGSWGLPLHLISLFHQLGVPVAAAVGIAALNGPATIAARLAEIALADRLASIARQPSPPRTFPWPLSCCWRPSMRSLPHRSSR